MSFLGATGTRFGFLVTSPLGFKARVGSALFAFCVGECEIHLWCYTCRPLGSRCASGHFPTCISRGGTWLGFEWAITWTGDERATIVPATRPSFLVSFSQIEGISEVISQKGLTSRNSPTTT